MHRALRQGLVLRSRPHGEQRQVLALAGSAGEGHAVTTDGGADGEGGDSVKRGERDGGEGGVEDGGEAGGRGQRWERGRGLRRRGCDSAALFGAAAVGSSRCKLAEKEMNERYDK